MTTTTTEADRLAVIDARLATIEAKVEAVDGRLAAIEAAVLAVAEQAASVLGNLPPGVAALARMVGG